MAKFGGKMHGAKSVIHSATKSSKTENFVPARNNWLFNGFLEIVCVLIPHFLQFNSSIFVEIAHSGVQTVEISDYVSNFLAISERTIVENVRTPICQYHVRTTIQTFLDPLIVQLIIDDDKAIDGRGWVVHKGEIALSFVHGSS